MGYIILIILGYFLLKFCGKILRKVCSAETTALWLAVLFCWSKWRWRYKLEQSHPLGNPHLLAYTGSEDVLVW